MAVNENLGQSSVVSGPFPPVVIVEEDSNDANSDKKVSKKKDQVPNFGQTN